VEEDKNNTSLEMDAEMTADLLRANVSLESERDRARDEVEQLTTQLTELRVELADWQTKYQDAELELDDARKRLASLELDYNRTSSRYDVWSFEFHLFRLTFFYSVTVRAISIVVKLLQNMNGTGGF